MLKFQRNYKIIFEIGRREDLNKYTPEEEVIVEYPFTLKLNIETGMNASMMSKGQFLIYNLSPAIRAKLWKDNFNQRKYITMSLYAGYGDDIILIFKADVLQCTSYRNSGETNYLTDIQTMPSAYLQDYGIANATYAKNVETNNLLQSLLEDLPMYRVGYITPDIPPLKKEQTFIGQTMDLLGREYSGYDIFVDKGELNILSTNDVVPGNLPVLTAESGLLGSPKRAELYLNGEIIFEPRLVLAQAVELISDSLPFLNNIYKVMSISHKGLISPVQCGRLTTSFTLYLGEAPFRELQKAAPSSYGGTPTNGPWLKPVQGKISSNFGERIQPTAGASHNHKGIDIAAPAQTPIIAPANGKVTIAGSVSGYGYAIYIDHGKTKEGIVITSRYGHLSRWIVNVGQGVSAGEKIGYVGSTGISTGPHLHFEVRENGTAVNPIKYIGSYG